MGGSRSGGGGTTVLVFEYVTGGGLAGRELPASWAAEGAAMRRAIAEDFAAVPGVRVVATVDGRVPWDPPPGVEALAVDEPRPIENFASLADYTVLIAPETDGLLAGATRAIERAGGRHLGSDPGAVELAGDKARLAVHFEARGIPTPPTRAIELPADWGGPIVIKPVDGAGSLATFVVRGGMIAQPFRAGASMSASFLVDRGGHAWPIAVGRQHVEVDADGRVDYRGGTVPAATSVDLAEVARAVDSVAGLRGFVGVDFLDDRGRLAVLEINPRPSTSYVGLARLLPPGTIAGAWLAAASGGLEGTGWPERLRAAGDRPPVGFGADGSGRPEG